MNAQQLIEAYVDDVVRRLGRKQRNDVGVELRTLLGDELRAQASGEGKPADVEMAMSLLRRFGRPEDVAVRYRKPGFPIIEDANAATFVKLSAIGMAVMWLGGLYATFRHGGGLSQLGYWWTKYGLSAFWWPGFLVTCMGIASWVRRRFPVADEWKPRLIDRDRINRPLWVVALAFFVLGTIWLTNPAQFVEQITSGRLARSFYDVLIYDDTFRRWRLPILLVILTAQLMVYAVLIARGRWQSITRWLDIALSASGMAFLFWSLAEGRIFQSEISDRVVRGAMLLIGLFVLLDIAMKIYRERARVRIPSALAR